MTSPSDPSDANPQSLLQSVRACQWCAAHLPHPPRPVLQWHPEARILIIGQAPGLRAHQSGVPFDDASGDRLRAWLGLDRETFYRADRLAIVPMGLCFPGSGARGDLPPRPECAPRWQGALLNGLPQVKLTLLLGRSALHAHAAPRRGSVTEYVLVWRDGWPEKVPLPHPSGRNNRWLKHNPWFEQTLLPKVRRRIEEVMSD